MKHAADTFHLCLEAYPGDGEVTQVAECANLALSLTNIDSLTLDERMSESMLSVWLIMPG